MAIYFVLFCTSVTSYLDQHGNRIVCRFNICVVSFIVKVAILAWIFEGLVELFLEDLHSKQRSHTSHPGRVCSNLILHVVNQLLHCAAAAFFWPLRKILLLGACGIARIRLADSGLEESPTELIIVEVHHLGSMSQCDLARFAATQSIHVCRASC